MLSSYDITVICLYLSEKILALLSLYIQFKFNYCFPNYNVNLIKRVKSGSILSVYCMREIIF